ncbi:MAG: D-tyrosyl-tRNA(Tyr) deacylase [Oscillospiraceae bacterium]|jgi:D-tyrosyl-tRNA(Tyr) deacylase|nr:D-tyrosyl-tRNA(Tyr) deacylase [Oscillospiraceae bacterium]
MTAVVQRVTKSSVRADGEIIGSIDRGLNILLGVTKGDAPTDAALLAAKVAKLRIFSDEADKMNLSVLDVGGGALVISQFTLCADIRKGNRPAFTPAAEPLLAKALYEQFVECLRTEGVVRVETGRFAARMRVEIQNDGPVTILMDTAIWKKEGTEKCV